MRILLMTCALLAGLAVPAMAQGNPEDVDVKITVRARDGRFVGTPVGGAYVIVRDRRNGDVLAEGVTTGGTGNARIIMEEGVKRDAILSDEESAKFEFSLAVLEPVPVTISARAPITQEQAAVTVSEDMILIPGKDYSSGNGVMLTVPGFVVDIASPAVNTRMKHNADEIIPLRVHVAKVSGDKPTEKGMWPASRYEVEAHVFRDSAFITTTPLQYGGEAGLFAANLKIPVNGTYRIIVSAFDPQTKESGVHSTTITLD
ncbi:MAG: hypothetical protein KKA05_06460 [Alphaproteobacteria bacterium]|nr:hypothetical protein [Alphaproteobacteria bacterium]